MEPLYLTALSGETQIDKELCETCNEEKRAKHEMEQEEQKKKQATHDSNKEKLCRLLKKHCTLMLMANLELQPNCNSCQLTDPMKPLEAIKSSCLNQMQDRHPGQSFFNAMKSLTNPKQHEDEKIKGHCSGIKSRITLLVSAVFNIIK